MQSPFYGEVKKTNQTTGQKKNDSLSRKLQQYGKNEQSKQNNFYWMTLLVLCKKLLNI
jgi:hypothetical protein